MESLPPFRGFIEFYVDAFVVETIEDLDLLFIISQRIANSNPGLIPIYRVGNESA